jgi:hypothetical protein
MASRRCKTSAAERAPEGIDLPAVERWRNSCPVRSEHKSIFPADEWLWQPNAAAWVWGVLKAAGGKMPAEELGRSLAYLRGFSHNQARGLRNRGLTVLRTFGLIEIKRFPSLRGGRPTSAYGNVSILRESIDEKQPRRKRNQAMADRWDEVIRQALAPAEVQRLPQHLGGGEGNEAIADHSGTRNPAC